MWQKQYPENRKKITRNNDIYPEGLIKVIRNYGAKGEGKRPTTAL